MKIEDIILERNRIVNSSCIPLRHTPLIPSDMTANRRQLEKVYKGMLREACVIDDCNQLFYKTFKDSGCG